MFITLLNIDYKTASGASGLTAVAGLRLDGYQSGLEFSARLYEATKGESSAIWSCRPFTWITRNPAVLVGNASA